MRRDLLVYAAEIALGATAYTLLWLFNEQLNPFFWERVGVSWLFLPAGLRLLLVLVCGWPGGLGLMIGGWITGAWMLSDHPGLVPAFGIINGLAPMVAASLARWQFGVRPSLGNLTPLSLLGLVTLFALTNAVMQQGLYLAAGITPVDALAQAVIAMFFGDLNGALVVLVLTSLAIRCQRALSARPR